MASASRFDVKLRDALLYICTCTCMHGRRSHAIVVELVEVTSATVALCCMTTSIW